MISKATLAINAYDRTILSKEQFSKVTGVDLETGEMDEKLWAIDDEMSKGQFLIEILDRGLITKEALLKQVFDIEIKEDQI